MNFSFYLNSITSKLVNFVFEEKNAKSGVYTLNEIFL
jgi:hypothetical protein